MQYKKFFSVLLVASTLVLSACNDTNPSNKTSYNIPATTSNQRVPTPAVYYDELDITKENDDVYLVIKGSVEDFTADKMNFAFGLMTYQSSSNQSDEEEGEEVTEPKVEVDPFIYGKATPADEDYKVEVPIVNKTFEARFKVSGIETIIGGEKYQIYAGPKSFYQAIDEATASEKVLQDNEYKYYFRNDSEAGSAPKLVIDNLGPVRIEKVTIEKNVYERTGIFAKIGGANKENLTQEQFDGFNSFVNFQKLPNTSTRVQKEGKQQEGKPYYFYKVEGDEAFIYINIDFMVSETATSGKYNTHLNIKENKQENCASTAQIDSEPLVVRDDGATIAVYSHPGIHNEDNIWGNVGFVVVVPEAEETAE